MRVLIRLARSIPLILVSPLLILAAMFTCAAADLLHRFRPLARRHPHQRPNKDSASIVIPNWNGADLLEKYLPSVIAAASSNPLNEVIVVDNGSTDSSVELLRSRFPQVRVIALPHNLGFGGGSNVGFQAANNDIVVLLNSDMRVDANFLPPLLGSFQDELVFAVACQIFFGDPAKPREETGLTQAAWVKGRLHVRHRIDAGVNVAYPCFYGGGGSCAFDRRKFLELGGFDELLAPFYLEDTDLGYMAWKRGWKVLYQPHSIVHHEHRGTIGKKFSPGYIDSILKKNFVLFAWKNIHTWRWLLEHFTRLFADGLLSGIFGHSPERYTLGGLWRACRQLPQLLRSRRNARGLATVSDLEAFRRPLGGYFRDRFDSFDSGRGDLRVLFVSPYPICPPVHGGGVFMYQTCSELAALAQLHLIVLIDEPRQKAAHDGLVARCASAEFLVRMKGTPQAAGSIEPHAIAEYRNEDLEWLIHRQIYIQEIDVLQLEYLPMGQYAGDFKRIPSILFEHDIYFQSIGRQLPNMTSAMRKIKSSFEYLRALRYELGLLPRMDRVQVCSSENSAFLQSFAPQLRPKLDDRLRAGIDTGGYRFVEDGREPFTMLFLGSFRHAPNSEALTWFVRNVMPRVLELEPGARLIVIGSDPPPRHSLPGPQESIELHGFVEDILAPLARYAVFVCPILSGSGVRVKLLEAFAAGIPVVSTRLGAEGLAAESGAVCSLADSPDAFASETVRLLRDPDAAREMARRARSFVAEERDMRKMTARLVESYRSAIRQKAPGA